LTPEQLRTWQNIFRDVTITVLAAFMLVYETVFTQNPNPYLIGAGLTLLGIPPALRLDHRRNRDTHEDPYDGPGGYYRGSKE
jgi:hypothetical protein